MRRLLAVLAFLTVLTAGCGGDDGGGDSDASTYEDVASLNSELARAGIDCALEYEGLQDADKEISTCVIAGEQATISIWFNQGLQDAVVEASGDTVAYGGNWTVQVSTAGNATTLAEALGGATGTPLDESS
ncbi:MAG: hypothetical protein AAGK32_02180 [Actinomycetota bacterium]